MNLTRKLKEYLSRHGIPQDTLRVDSDDVIYILIEGVTTKGNSETKEVNLPDEFQVEQNRLAIKELNK